MDPQDPHSGRITDCHKSFFMGHGTHALPPHIHKGIKNYNRMSVENRNENIVSLSNTLLV